MAKKSLEPVKKKNILYVLKNGNTQSKIGVAQVLETRVAQSHTYGFEYYNHYELPHASVVEHQIKEKFKGIRVGKATEVFYLSAEELDSAVSELVKNPGAVEVQQQIPVTKQFLEVFSEDFENRNIKYKLACELFAKTFNLGIPAHKLPEDLEREWWLPIDHLHRKPQAVYEGKCYYNSTSRSLHKGSRFIDHIYKFYEVVTCSTGEKKALCTAIAFMPYPKNQEVTTWDTVGGDLWKKAWQNTDFSDIEKYADDYGYSLTRHDEWSWWNRGNTGLFLLKQKTLVKRRLALWNTSLKKWSIESSKDLKQECKPSLETDLDRLLEDISEDYDFPLYIKNKGDFVFYLESKGIYYENEHSFPFRDAFDFLFARWKGEEYVPIDYRSKEEKEEEEEEEASGVDVNGEWVEYNSLPQYGCEGQWVKKGKPGSERLVFVFSDGTTDEDEDEYEDEYEE